MKNKIKSPIVKLIFLIITYFLVLLIIQSAFRFFRSPKIGDGEASYKFGEILSEYPMKKNLTVIYIGGSSPLPPTTIRTNSMGFRDKEFPEKNKTRIIAVGDSYTFGLGVEEKDTFPRQLEHLLGQEYEVLNLGVPGYNAYDYMKIIKDNAISLEPDMIIILVIPNDHEIIHVPKQSNPQVIREIIFGFADNRGAAVIYRKLAAIQHSVSGQDIVYNRSFQNLVQPFEEIINISQDKDIVILPILFQKGDTPAELTLEEYDAFSQDILEEKNIGYIDLYRKGFFNESSIYLKLGDNGEILDGHLGPYGNARLAEIIAEKIIEMQKKQ